MKPDDKLDWNVLAATKGSDVERPPLYPKGHYVALLSGRPELDVSKKKGTPYAEFPITVQEALEDVDAAELEAAGGLPLKSSFIMYFSPKTLWMFTEFAGEMGISDELSIPEMIEQLVGLGEPIVLSGDHEPNERNPDRPFFRLQNPMALKTWQERAAAQAGG